MSRGSSTCEALRETIETAVERVVAVLQLDETTICAVG